MRTAVKFAIAAMGIASHPDPGFAGTGACRRASGHRHRNSRRRRRRLEVGVRLADFKTADGIVGTPDGGVLFAQSSPTRSASSTLSNRESVFLSAYARAWRGFDGRKGRIYAVQRTCTDPGRAGQQDVPGAHEGERRLA